MKLRYWALLGGGALFAFGIMGCPSNPCTEKSGASPATDPQLIAQFPIRSVVDDENDLNLLNPLNAYFQDDVRDLFGLEDLCHLYCDYDLALVPKVLDIRAVNISDTGERWSFGVSLSRVGDEESGFEKLVASGQGRVAIYLDTDLDSVSDAILTTVVTADGTLSMVAVDSNLDALSFEEDIVSTWDETAGQLDVSIPVSLVGQHYDWVLSTGYAANPDATCSAATNEGIRWVPVVDTVTSKCISCAEADETSLLFGHAFRIASPCQEYKEYSVTGKYWCPTPGKPTKPLPKPIKVGSGGAPTGWLIYGKYCGSRKMEFYCSKDWIRWADNGSNAGWFAHCCFGGGKNTVAEIDTDSDSIPDGWGHTVKTPSGSQKVEYIYHFGPPYTYLMKLYSGTTVNTCKKQKLTDDPWALPWSHCSFP